MDRSGAGCIADPGGGAEKPDGVTRCRRIDHDEVERALALERLDPAKNE